MNHNKHTVPSLIKGAPRVDLTQDHYTVADAPGYGSGGYITVVGHVQTREEALRYTRRRHHMQAWRSRGSDVLYWRGGATIALDSGWVVEIIRGEG